MRSRSADFKNRICDVVNDWKRNVGRTPSLKEIGDELGVVFADLGETIGSEQSGIRPVIVIQNDVGNKFSPTVIVAPLTSKIKKQTMPTHVEIGERFGLTDYSIALLEQVRTIDANGIMKRTNCLRQRCPEIL